MKKLILSLTVAACAVGTGMAQAPDEPKRPATGTGTNRLTSEERLKMLTASLGLTQEQQDQIKKIFEESKPDFEKIRALPQEERRPKFRELTQAQNDKIAAVLTPEQKDKFKTAMANRAAQGRGQASGGGGTDAPRKEGDKAAPEEKK